jgi:ABC-2 type transport system permease protein
MAFPFSSPFAMLARAAQEEAVWPHGVALAWQAFWVGLTIKLGAAMFRKRVMKSGPQGARKSKRRRAAEVAAEAVARGPAGA